VSEFVDIFRTISDGHAFHEIPFGAVPHPEGAECPAQNWIDYGDENRGVALLSCGLPGNNVAGGVMMLSLLRSATIGGYGFGGGYEPGMGSDTGLELGKQFAFDYAVLPHAGTGDGADLPREGMAFNHPLIAVTAPPAAGPLAEAVGPAGAREPRHSGLRDEARRERRRGAAVIRSGRATD
jgi:alpha-mannosidase